MPLLTATLKLCSRSSFPDPCSHGNTHRVCSGTAAARLSDSPTTAALLCSSADLAFLSLPSVSLARADSKPAQIHRMLCHPARVPEQHPMLPTVLPKAFGSLKIPQLSYERMCLTRIATSTAVFRDVGSFDLASLCAEVQYQSRWRRELKAQVCVPSSHDERSIDRVAGWNSVRLLSGLSIHL